MKKGKSHKLEPYNAKTQRKYANKRSYGIIHGTERFRSTATGSAIIRIKGKEGIKICPKCGRVFSTDLIYCPNCQKRVEYKREYQKLYMRDKRNPNNLKYDERYKTREF